MELFNIVKSSLQNGKIQIIDDMGIRCKIGEYSFYFVESDCALSVDEYFNSYTEDMTAQLLTDILKTNETSEQNGIDCVERSYYLSVLGYEN